MQFCVITANEGATQVPKLEKHSQEPVTNDNGDPLSDLINPQYSQKLITYLKWSWWDVLPPNGNNVKGC